MCQRDVKRLSSPPHLLPIGEDNARLVSSNNRVFRGSREMRRARGQSPTVRSRDRAIAMRSVESSFFGHRCLLPRTRREGPRLVGGRSPPRTSVIVRLTSRVGLST
ncbi:hypothetical protein NL676_011883 [Syzygium grande]|nr:hypothetical protein NL676_011883 [Syzygium grande]